MKSKDIFALVVRIAGLFSLLYLLSTGLMLVGAGLPWLFVLRTIALALVSVWLLRGAPQLVNFAYRDDR